MKHPASTLRLLFALILLTSAWNQPAPPARQLASAGQNLSSAGQGAPLQPIQLKSPAVKADPALTALQPERETLIEQVSPSRPAAQPAAYTYELEWTGSQSISDNTCSGTHQFIPLNVADSFTITSLHLGFNASHTWRSDLRLWLHSPAGASQQLLSGSLGSSYDNFDLLFKDGGSTNYSYSHLITAPYYENTWAPQDGALSSFTGQDAQGEWQLEFCDDASGDTGSVFRWALFFNEIPAPNLSTSVKQAPLAVSPGELITYTVSIINSGSAEAAQASLVDPLPGWTTFAYTVTPGVRYNLLENRIEWQGGLLQSEQIDLTYALTVSLDAPCQDSLVNTAVLSDTALAEAVTIQAVSEIWDHVYVMKDFEDDNGGFTTSGSNISWNWGPVGPYAGSQVDFPQTAHSGEQAWATNLTGDYRSSENSYLTSPLIDLSSAFQAPGYPIYLRWWQWLRTETNYDFASLEARGGAIPWTVVYGPVSGAVDLQWAQHSVDISQFSGLSDFQLRFHFTSDISTVYAGWYIDDLAVVQCQPAAGIYLSPASIQASGCNGAPQEHSFTLYNLTGSSGVFDLEYDLPPAFGELSGPDSLELQNGSWADFVATLTPLTCLPDGVEMQAEVSASGNGFETSSPITKTITARGHWAGQPPVPSGGLQDAAVIDGGEGGLYAMGGSGAASRQNLRYDLAAGDWSTRTILPADLRILDGGLIDGIIYLPGGYNGSSMVSTLLAYNPGSDSWDTLAPAPRQVAAYGVAACGGKLYRVGGAALATWPNGETGAEVYNPASNAWLALPAMSGGHAWPGVTCLDGKLYVAGGLDQSGYESTLTEVFDIAQNTWSDLAMPDLPEARWASADFMLSGRLYMAGGVSANHTTPGVVYFDFAAQEWASATDLTDPRFRLEGDSAHVIGGMEPAWTAHDTHDALTLCPVCTQQGWLDGHVYDLDGSSPTVTPAAVWISPGELEVPVDASGYYTVTLAPWTYSVSASAENYPQTADPETVNILPDTVSTQDFTLPRPEIGVDPTTVSLELLAPTSASRFITITNSGSYPLDFTIHELKPVLRSILLQSPAQETPAQGELSIEIEPQLQAQLASDESTGYLIYLREQPDLTPALSMDWLLRGRWVVQQLQETAQRSQARLRRYLDSQQVDYRAYWVDNLILVNTANQAVFNGLKAFPEIAALRARRHPTFFEPQPGSLLDLAVPLTVQSNLTHLGADQVWAQGITGQGIVVANIDTGVNYTHEALVQSYRGSLGGGNFNHNHNWYDPSGGTQLLIPADWHNHGSHTMGAMVGSTNPADPASASQTIGMAPGARWIACRAFESSDPESSDQELLDCAQFLAAPTELDGFTDPDPDLRPQIINNSWGDCTTSYDPWYDGAISSWHALGIYPVFANGNASNCYYPNPPGLNTVGSPARAGNVTGVGATGRNNGQYATFSTWGPTDQMDLLNPLGYPRLKPQVVAPGTNTSAGKTGNIYLDMSGTSMATPHVSGLIALMWSAAPCLIGNYVDTETLLQQTATPIPYATGGSPPPGPGNLPNYATGWGEINALAAVQAAQDFCTTDWYSWVSAAPISGTVGLTEQLPIQLDFTCTIEDALLPQPLQGSLRVIHNDPSQPPVDIALELTCLDQRPDLEVTIEDEPDPLYIGETLTYTISVTNHGALPATSVVVTDTLPAGVIVLDATPGCSQIGDQEICDLGDLGSQETKTVIIAVSAPGTPGLMTSQVEARAAEPDPQPANNQASQTTTVQVKIILLLIYKPSDP
ncbi:MAG: S8 family serine peptidase [Anaerolineales bacterium]|nr:S8 family serine peptidase [Anaerolineales bacterium]